MTRIKCPYSDLKGVENNFHSLYGEVTEEQVDRYQKEFDRFKNSFNASCAYIASSSGRVEVCGNHTDHNGGRVVSCGISLDTLAMFLPTNNNVIHIKSEGYNDIIVNLDGEEIEKIGTSPALVRGVAVGLKNKGYKIGGFNACFTSNVLGGAGISSSASFEVLIAEILNFLYNDGKITAEEKAIVAQFSENKYFGKPCGLLDQTAIAFGGLKALDFAKQGKISVSNIDNSLSEYSLVLINTGGSHANLTGEYASIPEEMKMVAMALGKEKLIEITEEDFYKGLASLHGKLPDRAISRAVHFYNENKRVDAVANALRSNDYAAFIKAINESGISSMCKLQNCYVAGSAEQPIPKALSIAENFLCGGANRVHGGGFAGTILNIVKDENLTYFVDNMAKYYDKKDIIPLKVRSVGAIVL